MPNAPDSGSIDFEPRDVTLTRSFTAGAEGYTTTRCTQSTTHRSCPAVQPAEYEVHWTEDDPTNPRNWPLMYKSLIVFGMGYGATVVSLFSTSYSVSIAGLEVDFHISKITGLLGITTYLLGMAAGSLLLAPLSEMYGRRPIYLVAMGLFTILVIPCALANNIETILISRFFAAFFGGAMMSNSPGSVNDVVSEDHRALAFSFWSIGPANGPVLGPIIGGFVYEYLGWRWTNWVIMILGGLAFFVVALIEETYTPTLLRTRAAKKRQETGNPRWWSAYDTQLRFVPLLKVNVSRPFVMMLKEPIWLVDNRPQPSLFDHLTNDLLLSGHSIFWDWYVALVYGVLYLCFVAYPIAFQTERGWSPSIGGLAYLGIGCGVLVTISLEPLLRAWINSHPKDPETGKVPPEAMVRVTVAGAISLAVGQIWFAWTSTPNVHWIAPILAGIPFGAGNAAVFIYSNNYLAHSYKEYAASALAGNTVLRSILGAVLPLAGPSIYSALGLNWASFLLGMIEGVCVLIPVVFLFYGHRIRERSPMIRELHEQKRSLGTELKSAPKSTRDSISTEV